LIKRILQLGREGEDDRRDGFGAYGFKQSGCGFHQRGLCGPINFYVTAHNIPPATSEDIAIAAALDYACQV